MQRFFEALRVQRWDDHRYYHHSRINQSLHLVSAVSFLAAYVMMFGDPAMAALIGVGRENLDRPVPRHQALPQSSALPAARRMDRSASRPRWRVDRRRRRGGSARELIAAGRPSAWLRPTALRRQPMRDHFLED